jgi:hypothetical protein
MSFPWWKSTPTPAGGTPMPWADESPNEFSATRIRCSAEGCTFEGTDFVTAALGPGVRPYCQHHATGAELKIRDLMWKLPCACGRVADGFQEVIGGYSATHTERKCVLRTIQAAPEDVTVPHNAALRRPAHAPLSIEPRCACGKKTDGTVNASDGFTESHSFRECIEQTLKQVMVDVTRPARPLMSSDPSDALLLIGDDTVGEILTLARRRLPAARLQVLSLAAALVRAAADGQVPEAYVSDALKAASRLTKKSDAKPH